MSDLDWTLEIPARRRWFAVNLRELWSYRDLVALLVRRDFVAVYKQTILGPLWFVLQPLMTTLVFAIVFGGILRVSTGSVPTLLFYLSGVVLWNYFSSCLVKNADIFIANAGIFKKVYFPRLAVPLATIAVSLIAFLIQLALFLLFWVYFKSQGASIDIGAAFLLLPLLVIEVALLGFAVGILVASLTVRYRDLAFLTNFAVQLWMFATPVVYPVSMVPEHWQWVYRLNPMTVIIETFRCAFWQNGPLDYAGLTVSLAECLVLMLIAVRVFNRTERTFVDSV